MFGSPTEGLELTEDLTSGLDRSPRQESQLAKFTEQVRAEFTELEARSSDRQEMLLAKFTELMVTKFTELVLEDFIYFSGNIIDEKLLLVYWPTHSRMAVGHLIIYSN